MMEVFMGLFWPVQIVVVMCCFGIVKAFVYLVRHIVHNVECAYANNCMVRIEKAKKEN